MLLLNINRKPYMGSPVALTFDLEWPWRSKLRCRIWSKIDTCIVRYCVRVSPDFNWFSLQQWVFDTSLQKIANVIPTAAVKQSAKVLGPLVCFVMMILIHSLVCVISTLKYDNYYHHDHVTMAWTINSLWNYHYMYRYTQMWWRRSDTH